jgi:hypothetical protein
MSREDDRYACGKFRYLANLEIFICYDVVVLDDGSIAVRQPMAPMIAAEYCASLSG